MEKAQSINMSLCIKPCGVMEGISCHLCCLINHVIISLTFSAASPSLSVLLVMELLFTLASFWGAALVSKPAQWYILNNLVPGGLNTVCNSPAETRGWFLEVFCQEADLERGSGIVHSGGMWRWPRTESPLSGSYECLSALLSLSVLARTCSKKSTGRGRIRKRVVLKMSVETETCIWVPGWAW